MLGVFAAKSEQGPREAGTQHGCWDVFFQRSLFYNYESLLPTWGIFMTPCICLQLASGLLRNSKAEREMLYWSQSSRLGAVSKRAGVASWSTNPAGKAPLHVGLSPWEVWDQECLKGCWVISSLEELLT